MAKSNRLSLRVKVSAKPMSPGDRETATELLAELIARAYIADHPEAFERRNVKSQGAQTDQGKRPITPPSPPDG